MSASRIAAALFAGLLIATSANAALASHSHGKTKTHHAKHQKKEVAPKDASAVSAESAK